LRCPWSNCALLLYTVCTPFPLIPSFCFFFFNDPATTEIYTLSLHDALPIYQTSGANSSPSPTCTTTPRPAGVGTSFCLPRMVHRSEEHTSELQSRSDLVCRLLLEKKKKKMKNHNQEHLTQYKHNKR